MNNLRLIIAVASIMIYSITAFSQIPNSGFENWTSKGFPSYVDPDNWGTVNSQTNIIGIHTVQRASGADAHSGSYAVKLVTTYISFAGETAPGITVTGTFNTNTRAVEGGFPFTQRPTGMKGWFKYAPATDGGDSDSLSIEVDIWKWDATNNQRILLIDDGFATGQTVGSYMEFTLPFNWTGADMPDSAQIVLSASRPLSPIDGSTLIVDDLEFYTLPLAATKDSSVALCAGVCDGTASVTVDGGNAPYTYLWSSGETTAALSNVCPGSYIVTVTDAANTTLIESIVIDATTSISVSTSSVSETCGQADGEAIAVGSSGNAPYSYLWDDGNTQANDTASNLSAGNYNVTVTDAQGCTVNGAVTVSNSGGLTATTNTQSVSCSGGADGAASVTPSGGSAPITYLWGSSTGNSTDSLVTGLSAGTYSVTVTDNNGCDFTTSATVTEPTAVGVTITITDVTCNGGSDGVAAATGTGGASPYTYVWDDAGNQTTATASNLPADVYSVTVTDNNGCTFTSLTSVLQPDDIAIALTVTDETAAGNEDGKIDAVVTGGTSPYTYAWNDSGNQTTAVATGLPAGVYTVTVTDANGCEKVASDTVDVSVGIELVDQQIELHVYPNPATDVLNVQYDGVEEATINIYDLKGQMVEQMVVKSRINSIVTSGYAEGIYVYELHAEDGRVLARGKFVVSK